MAPCHLQPFCGFCGHFLLETSGSGFGSGFPVFIHFLGNFGAQVKVQAESERHARGPTFTHILKPGNGFNRFPGGRPLRPGVESRRRRLMFSSSASLCWKLDIPAGKSGVPSDFRELDEKQTWGCVSDRVLSFSLIPNVLWRRWRRKRSSGDEDTDTSVGRFLPWS